MPARVVAMTARNDEAEWHGSGGRVAGTELPGRAAEHGACPAQVELEATPALGTIAAPRLVARTAVAAVFWNYPRRTAA